MPLQRLNVTLALSTSFNFGNLRIPKQLHICLNEKSHKFEAPGVFGICRITHEELQGYVVDEDVIQGDNTQLAEVGCQLQGVHLLHNQTQEKKSLKTVCEN